MQSAEVSKLFLSINELETVFSDLTPVPQEETSGAAARIDYSEDFIKAYDYQRAVWRANEINTTRALQLTALCLRLNPANYTVWHFRRLCLEQIYQDGDFSFIPAEMGLAAMLGGENPKNYQIWYHRRALLDRLASHDSITNMRQYYQDELDYIASVVHEDGKNYHAWSHRQWVTTTIANKFTDDEIWKKELEFSNSLIERDPRNNSAWNQRWFAAHKGQPKSNLSDSDAAQEADYALVGAKLDPYNESPWRYLIAILKEQVFSLEDGGKVTSFLCIYYQKILEFQEKFSKEEGAVPCIHLIAAMIDILEWRRDADSVKKAICLATSLANEYDMIRQKYWNLRVSKLEMLQ